MTFTTCLHSAKHFDKNRRNVAFQDQLQIGGDSSRLTPPRPRQAADVTPVVRRVA